ASPPEPGWRHESNRPEPAPSKHSESARHSRARVGFVEHEEFGLAVGTTEGAQVVGEPARRTRFVVTLAVDKDLRAFRGAGEEPPHESRESLEPPLPLPAA